MRVVVVGAGVMGAWTALWLRRAGHDVTLVDRHGPGNRLGSSGDVSRITRSSHGPDRFYPVWQRRALAQWRELERSANETLFVQAGVVWLVTPGESFEAESLVSLTALDIPVDRWSHDQFAARVPVMSAEGVPWALHEPEAGALFARPAVSATIRQFEAAGGAVVVGRVVPPLEARVAGAGPEGLDGLDEVTLDDGRRLAADAFVFACGPWLPDLFPTLLGDLIVPHRQDVLQFAVPSGDGRYGADAMPLWIDFGGSFYGFPSFDGIGLKACPDWLGPIERPDESAREVAGASVEAARKVLRKRFPALAAQPVVRSSTCFYEVTPDAHFVIDRHPGFANAWIAGGGTGHAFKHGPVIGEYLAALVTGDTAKAADLGPRDGRFALHARDAKPGFRTSGRNPLADPVG
ncbi:MAG TPA: FAD-dependent oxidoreductase [Candidatus Dormibacteraeota bacterium]|nr:FAD-dependent oxidoreductase [Candidatus Dormibacteraeota bacterium]